VTFLLAEQETTQLRRRLICAFAQIMSEAKSPSSGPNPDDVYFLRVLYEGELEIRQF